MLPQLSPKHTERTIKQFEFGLDEVQQELVEKDFKKNTPLQMAKICYGDDTLDEHTKEFDNVKRFYGHLYKKVEWIEFTPEQIRYLEQNYKNTKPYELAKNAFSSEKVHPLGKEVAMVTRYCAARGWLYDDGESKDPLEKFNYYPPNTDLQVVKKINFSDINANFDIAKLTIFQKKCIESLKKYLSSPRFVATISCYQKQSLRDLFESTFIQATYDKPDLNSEEQNMCINLCSDYVLMINIQKQMTVLHNLLDEILQNDEADAKIHMGIADAYTTKVNEYDKCQSRMQKLQESLSDKRSNRLKEEKGLNESLTRFVELWKNEEDRKKMLLIAQAREVELNKEVERLENFSELIAHVMGVGKEEVLNS